MFKQQHHVEFLPSPSGQQRQQQQQNNIKTLKILVEEGQMT